MCLGLLPHRRGHMSKSSVATFLASWWNGQNLGSLETRSSNGLRVLGCIVRRCEGLDGDRIERGRPQGTVVSVSWCVGVLMGCNRMGWRRRRWNRLLPRLWDQTQWPRIKMHRRRPKWKDWDRALISSITFCPCMWNSRSTVAGNKISKAGWGFNTFVWTSIFRWFPVTPTYLQLCTVSSSVYSGYLLSTYRCGIRILSAMETKLGLFLCSLYCTQARANFFLGGCLFTQSHADHVIGLQDERSLHIDEGQSVFNGDGHNLALVCVCSSTGKKAL